MATTTNYGWTTPDDTDLVKDGAAAIRTLGSSVDTTTKALNPSTTEGDLEYRSSTANTNSRLAIGTVGQVLTVNSGANAPEWATAASGSTYVGVKCGNASDFSIANNTNTAVAFTSESFDTDGFHDNSTNNSRITIPSGKGGYYQFYTTAAFSNNATGFRQLLFKKNGIDVNYVSNFGNSSQRSSIFMSATINCSVGDYVEVFAYQDSGSTLDLGGGVTRFYFGADYLGA